jgi:hypothetical protein
MNATVCFCPRMGDGFPRAQLSDERASVPRHHDSRSGRESWERREERQERERALRERKQGKELHEECHEDERRERAVCHVIVSGPRVKWEIATPPRDGGWVPQGPVA